MRRYQGETLRSEPRIAVVANDAIGNFVVGTPLMQMLRSRWNPRALDYYGGTRTWELVESSDLIDFAFPLHGAPPSEAARAIAERREDGEYDLVVNMEWTSYAKVMTGVLCGLETFVAGPCIGRGGRGDLPFGETPQDALWKDQEWISSELSTKYPFLKSSFIGEIFARLAYLEGDVPRYRLAKKVPIGDLPKIWIATAASLPEKLWTYDKWHQTLTHLVSNGARVGLLGAPPAAQKQYWQGDSVEDDLVQAGIVEDFRGKFSLPEVVGVLDQAKLVLTIDNGILHLACAGNAPVVGLFRQGIHRLWAPPSPNLHVLTPDGDALVNTISAQAVIAACESCMLNA